MTEIAFYKYQGTGNDFIIMNNLAGNLPVLSEKDIEFLCHRRFGIGADGLMLLNKKPGYDFEMLYYNADGKEGSMCGNGGRCIAKFYHDTVMHNQTIRFLAMDGPHVAEIDDELVKLKMQDVDKVDFSNGHTTLNTGSPHYIAYSKDVLAEKVVEHGRKIRQSPLFNKEGINVNFVEQTGPEEIFVRTYERGVEDETFSCGTGVTAAALMSAHNDNGFNTINVRTRGGKLSVEFVKKSNTEFVNIWLCGPVKQVFKGIITL